MKGSDWLYLIPVAATLALCVIGWPLVPLGVAAFLAPCFGVGFFLERPSKRQEKKKSDVT